jgi:hypothetical protein
VEVLVHGQNERSYSIAAFNNQFSSKAEAIQPLTPVIVAVNVEHNKQNKARTHSKTYWAGGVGLASQQEKFCVVYNQQW